MKGTVSKKIAAGRRQTLEERQIPITEKNMDRFVGRAMEALIEEQFASEPGTEAADGGLLCLGRLYCHAPEVDGAAVIVSDDAAGGTDPQPGCLVAGTVVARRGFDLEFSIGRKEYAAG
jgi:ribosomal protein S12 methylthiotransferase